MSDGVWWISIAPGREREGGVVILPHHEGERMRNALRRASELEGVVIGGTSVMGNWARTDTWMDTGEAWVLRPEFQNRLVTMDELEAMGYSAMSMSEMEETGVEVRHAGEDEVAGNE